MESDRHPDRHSLAPGDSATVAREFEAPLGTGLAGEIIAGLLQAQAHVSPKFLYDALGSRLFEAITELPEYYPCRFETALLARHSSTLASSIGTGATLIELGAGNCEKAERLFAHLQPSQYVAVDIALEQGQQALKRLRNQHPWLDLLGVASDFSRGLALPRAVREHQRLFLFLGSSIGNFTPQEALTLLLDIRTQCGEQGALLIGVDLVKSAAALHAAYNDTLGVTAAFNLNLLNHLNVLIGSDFNVRDWRHRAFFNASLSRIEMHLEARRRLCVRWAGGERSFVADESIHTENSYKYGLRQFGALLTSAGFGRVHAFFGAPRSYALYLAQP